MDWRLTGYVWLHALTALVITGLVKVQFYRLLEHGTIQFRR